ncbi:MAG: DUF2207 domain-containing protein [Acidobacteriota bacterium]|nr:DUF2207 domain-containing protein [Acidobacteriota bacterium]
MKHRVCLLALGVLAILPVALAARTLNWKRLDVVARLDAEGTLHVREFQAMVFDGDWNGGERRFQIGRDQRIELHGVTRIDPTSLETIDLAQGSLSFVDHYAWHDRRTLRWRSRLPSDPEFDNETIIYVLEYTLSGVVQQRREAYLLDHDFAFADRDGAIERFSLDLELDPVWRPREGLPTHFEAVNLQPGENFVVSGTLAYLGAGRPAAVFFSPPLGLRLPLVGAALALIVVLFLQFSRFERQQGRFDEPEMPADPSRSWFEEHVLSLRPEEVGALWDQSIGGPEVSALLARLVAEGKLASRVEKTTGRWTADILHLELLVERDVFDSYERKLIDKLFFGGRTRTSTEDVRKHYKSSGFSPTSAITSRLQRRLGRIPGFGEKTSAPSKTPGLLLLACVVVCVALEALTRDVGSAGVLAGTLLSGTVLPMIVGYVGAFWRRRKAERLLAPTLLFLIPLALILGGLFSPVAIGRVVMPYGYKLSWFSMAALLLFGVAIARSFFNTARTRDSRKAVRKRTQLAAVRRFFQAELKRKDPRLEDEWFPYLLALGLAEDVDKWSVAHGVALDSSSRGASWSGGSSAGSWTGGGGRFGGAGASAGWAAAATGMAAGVASPSSSGGGGGGGGGGGSSGGGGGGGW